MYVVFVRAADTEQSSGTTFDGLRFRFLFYSWGEFLTCSAGVYTFLFIIKIHSNAEIRDRNLSPSKVVSLLWFIYVPIYLTYLPIK